MAITFHNHHKQNTVQLLSVSSKSTFRTTARIGMIAIALFLLLSAVFAQHRHRGLRYNSNVKRQIVGAQNNDTIFSSLTQRKTIGGLDTLFYSGVSVSFPAVATATLVADSKVQYEIDRIETNGNFVVFIVHDQSEAERFSQSVGLKDMEISPSLTAEFRRNNSFGVRPSESAAQKDSFYSTVEDFPCYRDLQGSFDLINDIAAEYPDLATLVDIGDSYLKNSTNGKEGYDMLVLKLTKNNGVTGKAQFFAMFGIHAREMAPPELGMRFAEMLVQGYGVNPDITTLLDYTEVHLLLQANPDGRYVAETKPQLLRRKNMRPTYPNDKETCSEATFGVDLNRNFPFNWGKTGSSSYPCASTYRGESPASEPEIAAIVEYVRSIFPEDQRKIDPEGSNLKDPYLPDTMGVFMDIHSTGGLNLYPWYYNYARTPNNKQMKALSIKFGHFNSYTLAGPKEPGFLYKASGTSSDWAYGTLGASSSALELGNNWYEKCKFFERRIVPGNLAVLLYAANVAHAPYTLPLGPDVIGITLSSTAIPSLSSALLSVSIKASDSEYSDPSWRTAKQKVRRVLVFVDKYPNDSTNKLTVRMKRKAISGTVNATANFSGDDLLALIPGQLIGRHVLHFQAIDRMGFEGPVSSVFLDICEPSDTTCLADYKK